jgi:UDP-N-acetylmuramoyl-tripeptide--D-alanyl-D-alanine ligase
MEIENLYKEFLKSGKVSTDTRKIEPGSIFFALKGPNFNANSFAEEAIKKGAVLSIIDDPTFAQGDKTVLVEDSLVALQALARHHRKQLSIPVIGLTGSNGKTTTKELLYSVLTKKFNAYATKGNLNNHIGVPLSILAIDKTVEIAVIEMGANHIGEIAMLCSMANPTHGLITNIGKAHIGTFGGFENIIRGKTELYQHLMENKGTVFINSSDPILTNMKWRFTSSVLYPGKGDYLNIELVEDGPFVQYKNEKGELIQTQLTGAYNFTNIAAALCVGKFFDVDMSKADDAIQDYTPSNMRSQVVRKGSNTILLDAYNANPSSMEVAIQNLNSINAENKAVILGDMFELEDESEREHRAIGQLLRDVKFKDVLLCGDFMKWAKQELPNANHFEKKEELINYLKLNPIENTTILVKASRGIGLETIVDYI